MFNFFRGQEKGKKIMLSILLGFVSLGMLMYLIPSGPSMGSTTAQSVVAEVAGEKITEDMVYRKIRQNQVPQSLLADYVPILIPRMIGDLAFAQQAERMGFRVSEAEVGRQIRTDQRFANLPPDQEANALQQMGYTVEELVADFRKNAVENMLTTMAVMSVIVTPREVEKMFRDANEKIKLKYIDFPADKFKSGVTVTPADLQAGYSRMKNSFTVPESRNAQVILIDQEQVAATIQIPEAQLRAYYDAHKDDFRVKDRVKLRRILFDTVGKLPDEVNKIKAKAQDVLKQARAGADFAELAKKNSQDQETADKGGDLDWVQREQLSALGPFADVAFKLKPGEIGDLVTTKFGFYIIKLEDKESAGLQPFEKVKGQIVPKIGGQLAIERMQTLATEALAELKKTPQNGEQIADKLGVQFVKADDVLPEGTIPGVGVSKELSAAIGSLAKGKVSESAILVSPTKLAVVAVTQVNPARVRPFTEVEAQVRETLLAQKSSEAVQQKAKQAADMLASNGGDIEAVAKSFGLEVKTSEPFDRNGSVAATMAASFFGDIFSKPIGSTMGPVNAGGQTVVAKLVEKTEPDMKELAVQRDNIVRNLKEKKLEERRLLLLDSIVQQFQKEGKFKYNKDVVNGMISRQRQS